MVGLRKRNAIFAPSLGFGWFELYVGLRDLENAERALMDVNESLLFPEQAQWLAKANRELGLGAAGPVVEAAEEWFASFPKRGRRMIGKSGCLGVLVAVGVVGSKTPLGDRIQEG